MHRKTLAPIPTSLTLSALMLAPAAFAADEPAKTDEVVVTGRGD